MTKTVSIQAFIHCGLNYDKQPEYTIESYDCSAYQSKTFILETTIDVEIPDDFNPIASEVARLGAVLLKAEATAYAHTEKLKQQIADLLMLEYSL